jgi:L-seryl-tRNA(Ser) seleniumtransferase
MIAAPLAALDTRSTGVAARIGAAARVADGRSMVGGGALPEESLPSRIVAVTPPRGTNATAVAARLRARAVVARVEDGCVLLDPRTIDPADDTRVAEAVVTSLT